MHSQSNRQKQKKIILRGLSLRASAARGAPAQGPPSRSSVARVRACPALSSSSKWEYIYNIFLLKLPSFEQTTKKKQDFLK
jgi:hypothetical protein